MFAILPVEIVSKIIDLTLPPFQPSSSRKRYTLLLKYTKVSWMWKEIAEEELYRNLLIDSPKSLRLIALRWKEDDSLPRKVESISIDLGVMREYNNDYVPKIYLVLNACSEVKEIWLMAFSSAVAFNRSMDWSALKELTLLHLLGLSTPAYETAQLVALEPSCFPSLKHLSIINCSFPTKPYFLSSLLAHTSLPRLTSLTYQLTYNDQDTAIQTIDPLLFNRIKSLILYDTCGDSEDLLMDSSIKLEALTTLVLFDARRLDSKIILSKSSPLLNKLIILDNRNYNRDNLDDIENLVNSTSRNNIKEILIPRTNKGPSNQVGRFNTIKKSLANKKISLIPLKFPKIGGSRSSFVQSLEMFGQLNLEY